ncbi:MAG: phosphate/phosphite/phosphonate ABC transporter substrate-binding protein [Acidimicrobiales bacterium]
MIASLAMYQHPQLVDTHNRYWALIRAGLAEVGIDAPGRLSQDAEEFSVWNDPALVLAHTCGMPYRLWLHDHVYLVGTPDFGVDGCAAGYNRSALVVRQDDERDSLLAYKDAVFAYNQTYSQSGYAAAYWHTEPLGFWFGRRIHTGGHLESARAIAERRADLAALDAVSWRIMQTHEPFVENLRVLEWTSPTPGLPYIASAGADSEALFSVVSRAIDDLSNEDRAALGITGLVRLPKDDYLAVPSPPDAI